MSDAYQCPLCNLHFSRLQRLESHLKRKISCKKSPETLSCSPKNIVIGNKNIKLGPDIILCQHCNNKFSSKDNLNKHLKGGYCHIFSKSCEDQSNLNEIGALSLNEKITSIEKKMADLKEIPQSSIVEKLEKQMAELRETTAREIANLKENPRVNNQILQVICIGNDDNYLDMLTQQWNNFDQALEYIKGCALSQLSGDCQLIEKIYLNNVNDSETAIKFVDKARTKIAYFNEKKEKVIDNIEVFGRKLANNLQKSYLKGVNYLIRKNLDNRLCPNKFLEEYDIQTWNQHIYDLSDVKYHRKIINQLKIPNNYK